VHNITVRKKRIVTTMPEASKEPILRDMYIFAASNWPALCSNWERPKSTSRVAIESSMEFVYAKIASMEVEDSEMSKMSHTYLKWVTYASGKTSDTGVKDEFRSNEYNLLFHGIQMAKMPVTQDLSHQLVRSFMTEVFQFAPQCLKWNLLTCIGYLAAPMQDYIEFD